MKSNFDMQAAVRAGDEQLLIVVPTEERRNEVIDFINEHAYDNQQITIKTGAELMAGGDHTHICTWIDEVAPFTEEDAEYLRERKREVGL